ncbi:transcriptional regulator, AraC family with amidase-like domain [Lentzea xinjiangensis]|uniref:Transcriptional regulator, AraC family with amidase-like domain n=1 Tax=Lentzea xinjiangensis TaxID=402600 RepID=A0A1H9W2N3_9PSEU|nr:helix-turn-helix domain-containing protein [Lentzea xinjiangensis]SES28118.1 transcriptional regulator, AraC family with amidase-like domain [Lentzea xinjiangensis]
MVAVLALPDTIAFDLATPVEVFGRALLPDGSPAYEVVVCGSSPTVQAGPIRVTTDAGLDALACAGTVVVPGRNTADAPVPPAVLTALRTAAGRGTRIASICVGAFVLAEAGMLDGLAATTHWRAADALARRYPSIRVDPSVLYIDNGQVVTSAGAAAGLDLCLHLVERDHGVAVAAAAARLAVASVHRDGGQAQFIRQERPAGSSPSLAPLLDWIERHAHRPLTLAEIAAEARVSVRTLNRRFADELRQSPIAWLTGVRLRHAQELLEGTDQGVGQIARATGFPTDSNFRAQFTRTVGVAPSAYRRSFRGPARRTTAG